MYGMVNKAIEEMVCKHHGKPAWEQIKERAGVDVPMFVSNEGYEDAITYQLVTAASELTGAPASQILEAFGEHWILHTAREGYGDLMDAGGDNLPQFLKNLPNFHTRVIMMFPNLQPPQFEVSEVKDHSLHLHYRTHRPGLESFVVGLLKGLGKLFQTPVQTRLIESRSAGADHDVFLVEW
ncbi:MAG: heme NO-binding domain-containing protein [Verrucomicrobia bacterium]|nr:heme NO-binding domain-containing protein [Verrucomicrobiota bacterium]